MHRSLQTIAELHALVLEQQASMAKMRQEIAERDQELERLKAQIDKLRRMHFGRKSEQLDRHIDRLSLRRGLEHRQCGRATGLSEPYAAFRRQLRHRP